MKNCKKSFAIGVLTSFLTLSNCFAFPDSDIATLKEKIERWKSSNGLYDGLSEVISRVLFDLRSPAQRIKEGRGNIVKKVMEIKKDATLFASYIPTYNNFIDSICFDANDALSGDPIYLFDQHTRDTNCQSYKITQVANDPFGTFGIITPTINWPSSNF